MSSRQLRKLQKQRDEAQAASIAADEGSDSADDSDGATAHAPPARPNLFAALGGEDEDEPPTEDEEDRPDEVTADGKIEAIPTISSKNKKKKKKKKAKNASTANNELAKDSEDEIDKALKDLKVSSQEQTGTAGAVPKRNFALQAELFGINPYHLKAMNEMRNLFGREVIESAQAEEDQEQARRMGGSRRQQMQAMRQQVDLETFLREPPGAPKLPEVSLRRNLFIQGKEHWPKQSAGGLTMKEVGKAEDGSSTEYAYIHEKAYDEIQSVFFGCVQLGDPMRMVHMLKRVPYHVSTLLQVSFVAKQDQNMALSSELCERALFTFGRVTTSAFRQDVEQGRARLDFRRPENRQFWLAGYHYIRSLLRKGTFRTALEWSKLLYALDTTDPFAMRHYLHFLAVRSYEGQWLLKFLDDLRDNGEHEDSVYIEQSRVLAKLQLGDTAGARADLEVGIKTLPWLYCALFQELGLDAPPSIWGMNAESDSRQFWVKLYIYLAKDIWNNTGATSLLQQVAKSMEKVDISTLPADDNSPGLDATRLAYLEGQTGLLAVAPRALLDQQPNYEFDPLPPKEEDNVFTGEGTKLPWTASRASSQAGVNDMLARLQAMGMRQGGGPRVARGAMQAAADPDNSDADYESDEELRRDLEEHARRANEPGMFDALWQMLGMRGAEQQAASEMIIEGGPTPGAWPEGYDVEDNDFDGDYAEDDHVEETH